MFKKNEIVYGKSQDYGDCIIQLVKRITKNIDGGKLKSPIWDAYILATNKDEEFMEFCLEKGYTNGFFENYDKDNYMVNKCYVHPINEVK